MAKKDVVKQAKKALAKKKTVLNIKEDEWRIAVDTSIRLEKKVAELNARIDQIVIAHTKCKSLKGM